MIKNIWRNNDKGRASATYEGRDLSELEDMSNAELRGEIKRLRESYAELQERFESLENDTLPALENKVDDLEMKLIEILTRRLECVESILFGEAQAGSTRAKDAEALYLKVASKAKRLGA